MPSIPSLITCIFPSFRAWGECPQNQTCSSPHPCEGVCQQTVNVYGGVFKSVNRQYNISSEARATEIAAMIPSVDYRPRHYKIAQNRVVQTCKWIEGANSFRNWNIPPSPRLLWCYGPPGAGKTVLTSAVVDHLQAMGNLVAFVYFDHHRQKKEHLLPIVLASLLRQILDFGLKTNENFVPLIDKFYSPFCKRSATPTTTDLLNILIEVSSVYGKQFYLAFDALDEYSENDSHVEELLHALSLLPGNVKVFVTSRDIGCRSEFCETYGAIQQEVVPHLEDVRAYVEDRACRDMRQFANFSNTVCEKVTECVMETQSFILARLHMDKLTALRSAGELRDALEKLSGDVDDAYAESIARIQRLDEYRKNCAMRILTWIACAYDVFCLDELQYALAIRPGRIDLEEYTWSEETITTFCMGLVKVEDDGINGKCVLFIHQTVAEFFSRAREMLMNDTCPPHQPVYQHLKALKTADAEITKACLIFLSNHPNFRLSYCRQDNWAAGKALIDQYPFITYIMLAWSSHAEAQEELVVPQLVNFLEDDDRAGFLLWLLGEVRETSPAIDAPYGVHVAATCGLLTTMYNLIHRGKTWTQQSTSYGRMGGKTPLHLAVEYGSDSVLELLLSQDGVHADPQDEEGRTPLSMAAEAGFDNIFLDVLLKRPEVNPNTADKQGRTPLSYAAESTSVWILKSFVPHPRVQWNIKDNVGRTPCSYAAANGDALDFFLSRTDVNFDSMDDSGRTPLSYAAEAGCAENVRALLNTGMVDPHSKDIHGRMPLSYAVQPREGDGPGERVATLSVLLQQESANINARDDKGRTALFYAVEDLGFPEIRAEIFNLLLNTTGIDIDLPNEEGQKAFDKAMANGSNAAAQLLLSRKRGF